MSGRGFERLADLAADICLYRNVLQVRVLGRETARCRIELVEGGMDASRFRLDAILQVAKISAY
jgi:hypothetical protein